MGTQLWCLVLSILLALVKSERHGDITESFYESQFSSPSPLPLPSTVPESAGLKEVVLYLTPEQVESLQAAGALVRPLPELVTELPNIQDQYQRNLKIQNTSEAPTVASIPNNKPHPGLDSYYMLFNIQEINDDLALVPQTVEVTTKIPATTPRHKYMKTRNRNKDKEYYAASNAKKSNRTKTMNQNSNSEYVRFLPNYEKENNLKMTPYRSVPIIPYHIDSDPTNAFIRYNNKAPTKGRNYSGQRIATERNLAVKPQIILTQTVRNEVTKSLPFIKATPSPLLLHTPVIPQKHSKPKEFIGTSISTEKFTPKRIQQFKIETAAQAPATIPRSRLNQDKLLLLLAPLYQHQTITEAISQKQEETLSEEGKNKTKLPQIKEAPSHDYQQFTTEIEKLPTNLKKQNTFAKVEAVSRMPPDFIKSPKIQESRNQQNQDIGDRVPIETSKPAVSIPTSVLVRSEPFDLPSLYPVTLDITRTVSVQKPRNVASFDISRGLPVPVSNFKVDMKNVVPILVEQRVPLMTKNGFVEVEKPILMPKAPVPLKHDVPEIVSIQMPETQTILRHIWEH